MVTSVDTKLAPKSALLDSPFWLLGVTVRDNRQRIVELADERSLVMDSDACHKARVDLTTPRNRLSAECAWLPGVSPSAAKRYVDASQGDPDAILNSSSIPALARANLLAASIEGLKPTLALDRWANWVMELGQCAELIDAEDVVRQINEDRVIAGFGEVGAAGQIHDEIEARFRYYSAVLRNALDQFQARHITELVSAVVQKATKDGNRHAPRLIDELIDIYAGEVQRFLEPEAENIEKLASVLKDRAGQGEERVRELLIHLDKLTRRWGKVAQPIQLSMRARGLDHDLSEKIVWCIRDLSISLFNKHDMLDAAIRLNDLLRDVFAEVPSVAERLTEDQTALRDIQRRHHGNAEDDAEWNREIAYSAEVGVVFKSRLEISARGISWKGRTIPLVSITRVRWGAVRRSVNGIPTGTDYTIGVGDNQSEIVIDTRRGEVFNTFTEKLWKAVCTRLMMDHLKRIRGGERISYGEAVVDDDGVELIHHKFLGSERVYCSWKDVVYHSVDGSLRLERSGNKKISASISYKDSANTHLLEAMVRLSFKSWKGKLSGLLDQ